MKVAFGIGASVTLYDNKAKHRGFHYKICKEVIAMVPVVIYTQKDFYLLDAFNERIEMLKSAGLIEYWNFQDMDKKIRDDKKSSNPAGLTFTQLIGSFQLLLLGYVSSVIALVVEMSISVIKDRTSK